jgi:hypothetical protein
MDAPLSINVAKEVKDLSDRLKTLAPQIVRHLGSDAMLLAYLNSLDTTTQAIFSAAGFEEPVEIEVPQKYREKTNPGL